jgi:hypothetical protein
MSNKNEKHQVKPDCLSTHYQTSGLINRAQQCGRSIVLLPEENTSLSPKLREVFCILKQWTKDEVQNLNAGERDTLSSQPYGTKTPGI